MQCPGNGSSERDTSRWQSPADSSTIQILVEDSGNLRVIRDMLSDRFEVITNRSIVDVDLYLVEDHLLSQYRDALREQVERRHPEFCPVVMVRRETTPIERTMPAAESGQAMLIDDYVDAPIDRQLLRRRVHSLLIRRKQSVELLTQVSTLETQERELRRFSRAVEGSGNAILLMDTEGVIEYANPAFEEMTGYDEMDAIGQTPDFLQTEDSGEIFDGAFWRTMVDRTEWEGELVIEGSETQRCVTDTSVTAIRNDDGEIEGFVAVITDITERIEREKALQDREADLDLLRQILSRYIRHNLRNDLNVIQGYAELLKPSLPPDQTEAVTKITETSKRLIQTGDAAQMISTFIERRGELDEYDLSVIVEEIAADIRDEHPQISVDVSTQAECRILGRFGIQEAIAGLIENAAVHHDAVDPWIRIDVREREGVRLVIEDNGPGIPPHELAVLERGEETPLAHSSGVGLWLSKLVIEAVDGELSFETSPEDGTRVTIEFPTRESLMTDDAPLSDLKAREQRLQTIIDRMTDAVMRVDASWVITLVDDEAEEILDMDAATLRGRILWEAVPGTRGTRFETVAREAMKSRSSRRIEECYEPIDIWLEVYIYPDFDGGLSFYFRDSTDRHRREEALEEERSRMELALKETNAVVFEIAIDSGRVTRYGEFDMLFEIPPEDVSTWEGFLDVAVHPDDRCNFREFYREVVDGNRAAGVLEYRTSPELGEVRWIRDTLTVETDDEGNRQQALGIARDITEIKESVEEREDPA